MLTGFDAVSSQPISLSILAKLLTNWTGSVYECNSAPSPESWDQLQHMTSLTCLKFEYLPEEFPEASFDIKGLEALTRLHTVDLSGYWSLATSMHHFTHVQRLELREGFDEVIDLRCLTLLTSLVIVEDYERRFNTLFLPEGKNVRLQSLEVLMVSGCESPYQLFSLDRALHLTSVHMDWPENLKGNVWPEALPCLSHVVLANFYCTPPSQFLLYPKLRHLEFSWMEIDTLPEHFAGLTQLEHLVMENCSFSLGFPQAILALSQLHTLSIVTDSAEGVMSLPEKLLGCASWPNLSVMRLLNGGTMYSLDSRMVLLLLSNAFRAAGKKSPLLVDEIYTLPEVHFQL